MSGAKAKKIPAAAPEAKPGPMQIAPYVGGKSSVAGANRVLKLSSNENPRGCSPAAREAYYAAGESLALYPDGGATGLREAIAAAEGIAVERIVCGAGSDELISLLCLAYAGPGDTVLHSAHGFLMYRISALAAGAEPIAVPERDLSADVDALIAAADERTKLVFLANPNNPTGTLLGDAGIRRLREGLPAHVVLVLDGAYAEYVDAPDYDAGARLVGEYDNVVMTRTFSKVHGLAALRLGWCYAPEGVIDVLNRVRGPFNVSGPALAAGTAAIRDAGFVDRCVVENATERRRLAEALSEMGVSSVPSHGNFLLAEFGTGGPRSAEAVDAFLQERAILIRRMESYGLPGHLRISIGTPEQNGALLNALGALPK